MSLLPVVRATWAPKVLAPVLHHRFSWKRMSMAWVLAFRPDRSRSAFVFSMTDGAYNTDKLIEFLTELRTHFAGEKLILIWDGLMAHRSER
ncbi:hypothetical protein [Rhodococcus jostii]|uniref:hypothetical protein n=1 Tax=Rhodococcus jostii TaxID=132919 RepID=UPI0036419727